MKSMYVRASAGALCAALLAGCGGSDNGSLVLVATVTGLSKPGLVLKSGDQTITVNGSAGAPTITPTFPNLIEEDSTIDVQIQTQPTAAKCDVDPKTIGLKANYYTARQVVVTCKTFSYTLGGTVSGLTADGLILNNGPVQKAIPAGSTGFTFDTPVDDGANYGVTVLQNPAGLVCSVANNAGTMPSGPVNNIVVTCNKA
ncbi:hypothetical protein [Pseudoduganella chitinolytica]|uniref:Uncharacterized protein n=1 Tax=Pseudoduganella chitinolytica TaxID=34070 RepID=A0ABY8B6S6_9BURK|nr:hypothetical protein [Pseudoduganella chitinolytica]WEF31632.1 hypothetical protein PX653_19530 [Pseudoduganella chitinolytica]